MSPILLSLSLSLSLCLALSLTSRYLASLVDLSYIYIGELTVQVLGLKIFPGEFGGVGIGGGDMLAAGGADAGAAEAVEEKTLFDVKLV